MRTTFLSLAWVAVCAAFAGLFFGIDFDLNFFSWTGDWHLQSVACIAGILFLIVATHFLAFANQKTWVTIVATGSCILLIGFAFIAVAPEPLGNSGEWFAREAASPSWYRWGRFAISCTPLGILCYALFRRKTGPGLMEKPDDKTRRYDEAKS